MYQIGDGGPAFRPFQEWLNRKFPSYSNLKIDEKYGLDEARVIAEATRRYGLDIEKTVKWVVLGGVNTRVEGAIATDEFLQRASWRPVPAFPGGSAPYVGYACPGTWGVWNIGPQCMAINRNPNKVYVQGVGFNTGAFLNPDPMHSYVEARNEGLAELLRLALPDPRPKFVAGYSLGADVVTRFLHAWPANRQNEIVGVFKFGDPGHLPGVQGSVNGGISRVYTPEWVAGRTISYQISGDMYGDAPGLLPSLYEVLTRMELSADFAKYLFTWITGVPLDFGSIFTGITAQPSQIGAGLLGLAGNSSIPGFGALAPILGLITPGGASQTSGPISLPQMLFNIPAIVSSLIAAMKFVFSQSHGKYWVDRIFDGMTAENHAAAQVARLAV